MTALRDEQITSRCKGQAEQSFRCDSIEFLVYFGEVQSKQLSRNDLAVVELDAVAIICPETWYSTIKYDDKCRCRSDIV